ncbi:hypothetical protein Tco_1376192, partial [Tanacetum coccineum]
MIRNINLLWKTISEKLNDASTPENTRNSMAPKSITTISYVKKEELRKKGIKSPSKLFSLKYLSPVSIKKLNKNPSAPKRVHFVNSIVILSKDSDTEEDVSSTNTALVIEEVESEFETDKEVEEILEEEEEDEDGENFNSFPTMKELSHHEWLLKNPRPLWVKARIRAGGLNNIKISYMIGHFFKKHAYIDLKSPINIISRDFMILEDTTSIIDRCLGEMVFGRPFIDETGLVYNKEEGTVMFKQDNEKIKFKMPYTMEIFKQTRLMGASTDPIPSLAYEEN